MGDEVCWQGRRTINVFVWDREDGQMVNMKDLADSQKMNDLQTIYGSN